MSHSEAGISFSFYQSQVKALLRGGVKCGWCAEKAPEGGEVSSESWRNRRSLEVRWECGRHCRPKKSKCKSMKVGSSKVCEENKS